MMPFSNNSVTVPLRINVSMLGTSSLELYVIM